MLKMNYLNADKVKDMIKYGDMSCLCENVHPTSKFHSFDSPEENVNIYYGRDRGEGGVSYKKHSSTNAFLAAALRMGCDFAYLYDGHVWTSHTL